jgi:transposase
MSRPAEALQIAREHRDALEALAAAADPDHRSVRCARALLLAADGFPNTRIAEDVGVSPTTVRAWRARFEDEGLNVLSGVRPGRGRKQQIPDEKVEQILHTTVHEDPPSGTRWTCRSMATVAGVSPSTVQRLWTAHGVDPALGPQLQASR